MPIPSLKGLVVVLLLGVTFVVGSPAWGQSKSASDSSPDAVSPSPPVLAVLVFVAHVGGGDLPISVQGLRHGMASELGSALVSSGFGVCADEGVESVMQAYRIRSSRHIEMSALRALSVQCGAQYVLLAQYYFFGGDMMLLVRVLEPSSAVLVGVMAVESIVDPNDRQPQFSGDAVTARLAEMAAEVAEDLVLGTTPNPETPAAAMFPTTAAAPLRAQADLVLHSLLIHLLSDFGYRIPDPGWVAAELRDRGVDPRFIDDRARVKLESELGVRVLLFSELLSDEAAVASRGDLFDDEQSQGTEQFFSPFSGSLRATDAATGNLLAFQMLQAKRPEPTGVFGIEQEYSWVKRFEKFAGELVSRFPHLDQPIEVK